MNAELYKIISGVDFEKKLLLLKDNKSLIVSLFSYETEVSKLINYLMEDKFVNPEIEKMKVIFLDNVISKLIIKPSDLISCLQEVKSKKKKLAFLHYLMLHHLVNDDFLIALGSSPKVVEQLPIDAFWIEAPIIKYGGFIIMNSTNLLSVDDVFPLKELICDSSLLGFLLGWAFEEDRLNNEAVELFEEAYPQKYKTILNLKGK